MEGSFLITGATGFIGRALVARLTEGPVRHRIRVAVRRGGGAMPAPVDEVVVGDVDGDTDWQPALADIGCVAHLAARAHTGRDRVEDSLAAFRRVNTDGALNLARQAAAAGVRRLVFLSSIKANGEASPIGRPFTERDPLPVDGADPYGVSKREAERGLREIAGRTGLEVVVIRPPLVYGPGAKANFAALTRLVGLGVPLPLGGVRNRRSLIALANLVDFIVLCASHPAAANETFLISDGEDLSTPELVRRLGAAMGRRPRLFGVPPWVLTLGARLAGRPALARPLVSSLCVECEKARRLLGWCPSISVDEGLMGATASMRRSARS